MDSSKDKAKTGGLPARQTNTSMNTRLDEMDAKLDKILESNISTRQVLDTLLQRVNSLDTHVETLTGKTHDNEVDIEAQKTRVTELEKKLDQAMEYIDQLENRNRQNNLRLLNVPEGEEEDHQMIPFLINIFEQKWSLDLKEADFERAHRVGIRKETAKHPRVIIFKLHHFQKKLEILRGSKKKNRRIRLQSGSGHVSATSGEESCVLAVKRAATSSEDQDILPRPSYSLRGRRRNGDELWDSGRSQEGIETKIPNNKGGKFVYRRMRPRTAAGKKP